MPSTTGARKRRQTRIAGQLEAQRIVAMLGRELRDTRRRLGLTQRALGVRVGLSQSRLSAIERGAGGALPIATWVALGMAVRRPVAMSLSRDLDPGPTDGAHLDIQEHLVRLARSHGWPRQVELATRSADPRHSVDVAVRDAAGRCLLLEAWNRFGDLGAALRSTDRKVAELAGLAPSGDVRACWVIRATAANRALVRRYPGIFGSRFPGSSRGWVAALTHGTDPPREPGLVWWSAGRLTEVRWPAGPM